MKKGSALLIVLGMMAFMVVSAVAFSMFMRQNRLPSSFLRQRIAASHLAKAALANAMREVDVAVGDNPYPGVGNAENLNYWKNRVYMGDNTAYNQDTKEESPYETVSTLTLEALAYLPPPLIDTVRYWSRRTKTAAWAPLGYDAGRYAYTAVNVSDYFDINRLRANVMRDSSSSNRISLAYLFGDGAAQARQAFDTAMDATRNDAFKTRLVSLADYNLSLKYGALSALNGSSFVSPFCEYIVKPPDDGRFYGGSEKFAKMQRFVTDSWYPGSLTNTTALVLTDANVQPLTDIPEDGGIYDVAKSVNPIMKKLNLAERVALVDYLDYDNVPLSLAMPTVERTPMLTGLQIVLKDIAPSFKAEEKKETIPQPPPAAAKSLTHRYWSLASFGDNPVILAKGTVVYPFDRSLGVGSYSAELLVKMVLSKADDSGFEKVRPEASYAPKRGEENWSTIPNQMTGKDSCWAFYSKGSVSISASGADAAGALATVSFDEIPLKIGSGFNDKCNKIFGISFDDSDPAKTAQVETGYDTLSVNMIYRTVAGEGKQLQTLIGKNGTEADLKLRLFAWVRIRDGSGKTVDLVPARVSDDALYNGRPSLNEDFAEDWFGKTLKEAALPFDGPSLGISLNMNTFSYTKKDFSSSPEAADGLHIYCNDPRYNWAPEDWYSVGKDEEITADGWWNAAKGSSSKPRDFFQFVANNPDDILQSMGELYNLPLVRNASDLSQTKSATDVNPFSCSFVETVEGRHSSATFVKNINGLANREYMWKTRYPFGRYGDDTIANNQDPFEWGILDTRGGVTVNPYSDREQLKAVFVNTPNDWTVAYPKSNAKLDSTRCFGPDSSKVAIDNDQLTKIIDAIASEIGTKTDWLAAYSDAPGWGCDNQGDTDFFGVKLGDEFHDIDRKFLYSFWKNCLGNDQQLFLIFVRAEPTVMGGSSAKQTPSQLGARAVALVWREPVSTINYQQQGGGTAFRPHRMRILFYHQFE